MPLGNEVEIQINLDKCKRKRSSIKSKLTLFRNFVNNIETKSNNADFIFPVDELKLRLSRTETLLNHFEDIQTEIECHVDDLQDETAYREQFENEYFEIIAKAGTLLPKQNTIGAESRSVNGDNSRDSDVRSNHSHSPVVNQAENNQLPPE
ncbi:hypothetical protein JTB14_018593 [Gonioctena quinquepunctata]|nr:hypothetical protein JTB14_018593 [Gonioctena quinquepunctata]